MDCREEGKEKMKRSFDFFLPRKDFAKILRFERRYYLLSFFFLFSFLVADGILLGMFIYSDVRWILISLIPVFSIAYSVVWLLAIRNGGIPIYEQCSLIVEEDDSLTLKCKRKPSFFYPCQTCFGKTMKVSKLKEKNGYYVIYDEKRQWAVIPKSIPLKEILNLDVDKK